jgi:hypothetical protein
MRLTTEPVERWAVWSVASGVLCLLLLALQTPVTEFAGMRVFDDVQVWLGRRSNPIFAAWVFLLCAGLAAVLSISLGRRVARSPLVREARWGRVGTWLGALGIVGLLVWECCGGFFTLFWAV